MLCFKTIWVIFSLFCWRYHHVLYIKSKWNHLGDFCLVIFEGLQFSNYITNISNTRHFAPLSLLVVQTAGINIHNRIYICYAKPTQKNMLRVDGSCSSAWHHFDYSSTKNLKNQNQSKSKRTNIKNWYDKRCRTKFVWALLLSSANAKCMLGYNKCILTKALCKRPTDRHFAFA